MNYSLYNVPYSGERPIVYLDLTINDQIMGRVYIRLFREVFPAAVENFVKTAEGNTFRLEKRELINSQKYYKETRRTFNNTLFHDFYYNNYIVGGDIYNNTGSNAGTIYSDFPIPDYRTEYFYAHEKKGSISLIPFISGDKVFFDSTFMILLNDINSDNIELYHKFDDSQVVIGTIYSGLDVIDKINQIIKPIAGKTRPRIGIASSGVYHINGRGNVVTTSKKLNCGKKCSRRTTKRLTNDCTIPGMTVYNVSPQIITNDIITTFNSLQLNDQNNSSEFNLLNNEDIDNTPILNFNELGIKQTEEYSYENDSSFSDENEENYDLLN